MVTLLRSGADKVSVNSAAVRDPEVVRAGADELGSLAHCLPRQARDSFDVLGEGERGVDEHRDREHRPHRITEGRALVELFG